MASKKLIEQVLRVFPHLKTTEDELRSRSGQAELPEEYRPRALASRAGPEARPLRALDAAVESERKELLEASADALRKVRTNRADELTGHESMALEAIVLLEGRPAILIQDGSFFPPPRQWKDILEPKRTDIENALRSVGRIEVSGHPNLDWLGTGFLVADDVILTNRHVAREFADRVDGNWRFSSGMSAKIDYKEELGSIEPDEFAITEIIGIHDSPDIDLAALRVERDESRPGPAPLPVAGAEPTSAERRTIFVVGYPAWDGRRNDPDHMRRIFSDIYNVKRLQPGEIVTLVPGKPQLQHDCSTLGGNSGSCVVDLETGHVLGLHFGGRFLDANHAVALWKLASDPLIQKAGIPFS